jgi:hydroxyacylglutathione hydrolase
MMEVFLLPILKDNYVYFLRFPDRDEKSVAVVDPACPEQVLSVLQRQGWRLTQILCTHHHEDHIGGVEELRTRTGAQVIGAARDAARLPRLDLAVSEGMAITLGNGGKSSDLRAPDLRVLELPGHTRGHLGYWAPDHDILLCGDTLFSLGCGRVFEGSMAEMWATLDRLRRLPPQTRIYCGHEYTHSNSGFALSIDPENRVLRERVAEVAALRSRGMPSLPSTIGLECRTNPFLRPDQPEIQAAVGLPGGTPEDVFGVLRQRKNVHVDRS